MKQNYYSKALLAALALIPAFHASAEWEQISEMPNTQAHFITSDGIHLLSDLRDNRDGGIYYSDDRGLTWKHTDVKDYNYNKFYETSDYLFALGSNGRVARSNDGGRSWEVMNYTNALRGIIDDKGLDGCAAYGMVESGNKLYLAEFNGGGILVSEDNGESWKVTDHKSMTFSTDGVNPMIDSFYNLAELKGQVYAFGALSVWRYDADADKWGSVNVRSNFMAVSTSHGDKLVCGRSVQNIDPSTEYLIWTEDGDTWNKIAQPAPPTELGLSLNVRAIHSDGQYIFTAGPDGIRHDDSNPSFPFKFCPDFFFTSDLGETWSLVDGLPAQTYPLTLASDDDYVYAAIYSPIPSNTASGLWRLPKSDLSGSGVKQITADSKSEGVVSNGSLIFDSEMESVEIWTIAGYMVKNANRCSEIDLSDLPSGSYIFRAISSKGKNSGKIIL